MFLSARDIVCEFIDRITMYSTKWCSIKYGPCQQPFTMTAQGSNLSDSSTTVKINTNTNLDSYCYTINASNGSFTLLMDGTYNYSK